jgi:hypothetical protein
LLFDPLGDLLGKHQRRQARRQFLEQRGLGLAGGGLFTGLHLLPHLDDLGGVVRLARAKDVRVAADELRVDLPGHVVESEIAALRRELGMEDDLDEHVAEFLAHVRDVIPVDRVEQLAAFVDQAAG